MRDEDSSKGYTIPKDDDEDEPDYKRILVNQIQTIVNEAEEGKHDPVRD